MALTDSALVVAGNAVDGDITHASLHTADPGATGLNEVTGGGYARLAPAFSVDADGDLTLDTPLAFSGPASGACTHVGLWSSTNFRGGFALTGDQAFNAAGEYTVDSITIDNTAS